MRKTATPILIGLACADMILTEILRSIIHRRREQRDGLGRPQDIAMWGTLVGWALLIAAVVCGVMSLVTGEWSSV